MKAILSIIFIFAISFGWINNIIKLSNTDFEPPLKAEFIRGVGIFIFPVGVITGYMEIEDN